ncbi:MAG TPA: hypothetical protein VFQ42_04035 [Mycobacterium sp.]|nr:hypothetical protein [Mycobacterium sp.]
MTGPIFDGRAAQAVQDYIEWAASTTGQQAMADWHTNLEDSLQYPTGYYESTIQMDPFNAEDGVVVHDDGVIYNYWLEGYGSRNFPVTRFEGYRSAERAAIEAKARMEELVNRIPAEFIGAMGGASA